MLPSLNEFPAAGLSDPRLTVHASGSLPAWLWTLDGSRVLWANPAGAQMFGAADAAELSRKVFGPSDIHRRQMRQLAPKLQPDRAARLERLRGFGTALRRLVTCGCTRLSFADGEALLIVAAEPVGPVLALRERLHRLVEGADVPLAAFGRNGGFVGASGPARALLGFRDLTEAGLDGARDQALRTGRAEQPIGIGKVVLQRVGSGHDVGLIARLESGSPDSSWLSAAAAPPEFKLQQPEPAPAQPAPAAPSIQPAEAPPIPASAESAIDRDSAMNVADEGAKPADTELPVPEIAAVEPVASTAPLPERRPIPPRDRPLRFLWSLDRDGVLTVDCDELLQLLGPRGAATLALRWTELAPTVDPSGDTTACIASHSVFSARRLELPVDDALPLAAELSGLPMFEKGEYAGYRGFGVVTDVATLTRLAAIRSGDLPPHPSPTSPSAHRRDGGAVDSPEPAEHKPGDAPAGTLVDSGGDRPPAALTGEPSVDVFPNVLPFPASTNGPSPSLTPGENSAFHELARELSARLEADPIHTSNNARNSEQAATKSGERLLLDLSPSPIVVFRGPQVLYANAGFLRLSGHKTLIGLEADFDQDFFSGLQRIALDWDGEAAEALIGTGTALTDAPAADDGASADAQDLGAILDAADQAVMMFDADGIVSASNLAASRLFGAHGDALRGRAIADLFDSAAREPIAEQIRRLRVTGISGTVEAQTAASSPTAVSVRLGRARPDGPNFYAVIHDASASQSAEAELLRVRREKERALDDKSNILTRISDEMRAPLNAIIGFVDLMIEQRFGPLGNARYLDHLRDVRGCGERVVAIIDDLLELSQIESGKRDLAPSPQDLNGMVEQCVAALQPQANRERIIIRSSLVHPLPQVIADGPALRQIALNLIGSSIRLAHAGGQVIVSTMRSDCGDVLLRVRDTGHGLNDNEVASALAPFRDPGGNGSAEIRLSLTRALVEANHARFAVRPALHAGTMIEVAFPAAAAG